MDYKVTLIVKSDLYPEEIQAAINEAVEVEYGHAIEIFGCFVDEE